MSHAERQSLDYKLRDDARDYYHSALVSLIDGLRSIQVGFFTWATVKLYYSVFYALRSRMALGGDCIFYENSSPRFLASAVGSNVIKMKGTTHSCVLNKFASISAFDFFLSQDIDAIPPLTWLEERRIDVNYKQSRFSEPAPPVFLYYASSTNLRQALNSYLSDDIYIHDPEHAMVAFPFRLLIDLRVRLMANGISPLSQMELDFLADKIKDRAGALSAISPLLA